MILVFCAIGVFSLSNTTFDVQLMVLFGVVGYVMKKIGCEPAPMLLGFILGPMMEEFLRRALLLSMGDPDNPDHQSAQRGDADTRCRSLVLVLLPSLGRTRQEAFKDD